jgi:hypothetical protein
MRGEALRARVGFFRREGGRLVPVAEEMDDVLRRRGLLREALGKRAGVSSRS